MTMILGLTAASSALFTSVALLTKHDHWPLQSEEAKALAEALNDCFDTLSSKHYEFILAIIEKWVPWINLIFVTSAIIVPRIEESAKRVEESRYQPSRGSDGGDRERGAQAGAFNGHSSLGFDAR